MSSSSVKSSSIQKHYRSKIVGGGIDTVSARYYCALCKTFVYNNHNQRRAHERSLKHRQLRDAYVSERMGAQNKAVPPPSPTPPAPSPHSSSSASGSFPAAAAASSFALSSFSFGLAPAPFVPQKKSSEEDDFLKFLNQDSTVAEGTGRTAEGDSLEQTRTEEEGEEERSTSSATPAQRGADSLGSVGVGTWSTVRIVEDSDSDSDDSDSDSDSEDSDSDSHSDHSEDNSGDVETKEQKAFVREDRKLHPSLSLARATRLPFAKEDPFDSSSDELDPSASLLDEKKAPSLNFQLKPSLFSPSTSSSSRDPTLGSISSSSSSSGRTTGLFKKRKKRGGGLPLKIEP